MLLFPWTFHFHVGAWAYAGQTGRVTDAAAYFSGLGGMWNAVWMVYGLYSWRVLTGGFFDEYIYPGDPVPAAAEPCRAPGRAAGPLPRGVLLRHLTLDRLDVFWAHVLHHYPYDLSWGGPHWVHAAHP